MTDDDFVEERELLIKQLDFDPPKRHDEGHIDRFAESIVINGLINPVIAHPVGPNRWKVDAGSGRIHAHIRLGKKSIRARIYQYDPLRSRLRHIDENICRVEVDSYEWDRLVTERIEIMKQLDPKNRAIKDAKRPPKVKSGSNDSAQLTEPESDTMSDAPRQIAPVNAVYAVAHEIGCNPRKVERAKARVEKAAPPVAEAHAKGDLKATQVNELIKIDDPIVQTEVAAQVVGKTIEETKEIVADIVKPPSERLDAEMNSAVKLAAALTTRLQTIKRLMEIEGLTPSDVTRTRFADVIDGLKPWL